MTDTLPTSGPNTNLSGSIKPRRVGGWLIMLILILLIVGPTELVISTYLAQLSAVRQQPTLSNLVIWSNIQLAVWFSVAVQIAIMVGIGVILLRFLKRSTVRVAILMIWVIGPLWNVVTSLVLRFAVGVEVSPYVPSTLCAFLFSSLCTLYLLRSKRVRSTYPDTHDDLRSIAAKFEYCRI